MDAFKLDGRIALVTGSSAGIGEALARGLAQAGAEVVINGRRREPVDKVVQSLLDAGLKAHAAPFDVTDPNAAAAAVEDIETHVGPIDILVNNAGIQRRESLEAFDEATWRELMSTNLDSVFYVSKPVANRMIPRKRGSIINICSVQSELGRPGIAPYATTKGAVKMLTKGMCIDWAGHGIQVNAIGPGYFKTPLNKALVVDPEFSAWLENRTPAGRWGDVEELAGAAVFLASKASSFINGHIL